MCFETDSFSATEVPWATNLESNGRNIDFKIDTGADLTVISEQEYVPLKSNTNELSVEWSKPTKVRQFIGNLSDYTNKRFR